jgi:hypothetical protein
MSVGPVLEGTGTLTWETRAVTPRQRGFSDYDGIGEYPNRQYARRPPIPWSCGPGAAGRIAVILVAATRLLAAYALVKPFFQCEKRALYEKPNIQCQPISSYLSYGF